MASFLGILGALYAATMFIPSVVSEGEVYDMTTKDGKTVSVRSCGGGYGKHSHKLIQNNELTTDEKIVFTLDAEKEDCHTHTGNNPHTLDVATGEITPGRTSRDGGHVHCLHVVKNR
jgi:hypothetical protein